MTTTENEWRLFRCSDCDEDNPYELIHRVRAAAPYDAACDIEWCPRCDSYLSLLGHGVVTVTPFALVAA